MTITITTTKTKDQNKKNIVFGHLTAKNDKQTDCRIVRQTDTPSEIHTYIGMGRKTKYLPKRCSSQSNEIMGQRETDRKIQHQT